MHYNHPSIDDLMIFFCLFHAINVQVVLNGAFNGLICRSICSQMHLCETARNGGLIAALVLY